jgi:prepilin-type processing-associated H-X9-DG protein
MKTCFILNYWADTEDKKNIVKKSAKQIKKTGYETVYTSLCPVDDEITKYFNYVIYSKTNDLIDIHDLHDSENLILKNTFSYIAQGLPKWYSIPLNFKDVSFSMCRQLVDNLLYLKNLGFTHFHYMVGDSIINDDEINNFSLVEKFVEMSGKMAYFEDHGVKFYGYGSLYWYSNIDFFISVFGKYRTKKSYLNYTGENTSSSDICLETFLKKLIDKNLDKIVLNMNNVNSPILIFKSSELDVFSNYNTKNQYALIPNTSHDNFFIFLCCMEDGNYNISINGDEFKSYLNAGQYLHRETSLLNFNLKFYKNDILDFEIDINETNIKKICNYSFFDGHVK